MQRTCGLHHVCGAGGVVVRDVVEQGARAIVAAVERERHAPRRSGVRHRLLDVQRERTRCDARDGA